jgi:phospholipid N-methyltransferase
MVHNNPSAMCGVALKTAKRHVWKRLDYRASANDDGGIFSLQEQTSMNTLVYMKNFMKDKYVASITPTSPFGVKRVCDQIDFRKRNVIVEYGAGTGVFTQYLLKNMGADSRLIVIERNKHFDSILKSSFRDPRVAIFNESAENVLGTLKNCCELQADYVISGIPFLWLSEEIKCRILYNTRNALREGGRFIAYQTIFQTSKDLKVYLERFFRKVRVQYEFVNIPPLCIYEATK